MTPLWRNVGYFPTLELLQSHRRHYITVSQDSTSCVTNLNVSNWCRPSNSCQSHLHTSSRTCKHSALRSRKPHPNVLCGLEQRIQFFKFFFSDFIENLVDTLLVIFGGLLPSTNYTADLRKRRLTLSSRGATGGTVDEANKPKSS